MKKPLRLLPLILCALLLLTACGGKTGETGASQKEQTAGVSSGEAAQSAAQAPNLENMSLPELTASGAIKRGELIELAIVDEELTFTDIVEMGIFDTEELYDVAANRMPSLSLEEVESLGVFSEEELAELSMYRDYLISQMPESTPAPTPVPDPVTGVTVGITMGTASQTTGYAVPSGETLSTGDEGSMELDLGDGNYIHLQRDTQVTLLRFGDKLRVDLTHGWLTYFLAAPEKLGFTMTCVNPSYSVDMESRCGFLCFQTDGWTEIVSYLGQMTMHLKDGSEVKTQDGMYTVVKGGREVEEREAFSGNFRGMTGLIANHYEIADALAEAYSMEANTILLAAGIRLEPEIIIRDRGNGTYDRRVIDVNGDVVEDGIFKTEDDSLVSNYIRAYDENHRRIREEWNTPGNYWDGKVITWTYYDTGEVKTDSYTMPDGRFENREYDKNEHVILMEEGVNGVVETHRETEYNAAGTRIHERTVGKDYIAEHFYDDAGRTLRSSRTDREGNPLEIWVYTYHENGERATSRHEYYRDKTWYEATYDEAGNVTSEEHGKLE